jgi:hypothetical protein
MDFDGPCPTCCLVNFAHCRVAVRIGVSHTVDAVREDVVGGLPHVGSCHLSRPGADSRQGEHATNRTTMTISTIAQVGGRGRRGWAGSGGADGGRYPKMACGQGTPGGGDAASESACGA